MWHGEQNMDQLSTTKRVTFNVVGSVDINNKSDPSGVGSIVQNVKAHFRVHLNNTSFDTDTTWCFAYELMAANSFP